MGRYDPRQIFKQEPNTIRTAVLTLLAIPVFGQWVEITAETVAAVGLAVETVLSLFYVRQMSVSKDALTKLVKRKAN